MTERQTPRPWRVAEATSRFTIQGADLGTLNLPRQTVARSIREPDAALIVAAVNSYGEALALAEAVEKLSVEGQTGISYYDRPTEVALVQALAAFRSATQPAEEKS